jgi:hypothetical protein
MEVQMNITTSMESRFIISGLALFARGAASGMMVRRGVRCAKVQCLIITLGDWKSHLRLLKFEGDPYVDQIMGNTTRQFRRKWAGGFCAFFFPG